MGAVPLPSFDYIENADLRMSLERDYGEMEKCRSEAAWKGLQVLAGSIIEALLVDYLTSTKNDARTAKDPLRIDLSEAIDICKNEGVLSQRTADLCSVIRSYRNLIHPGRMIRLGEPAPDADSGVIAFTLVEIITKEIASVRRSTVGLTAEQLLAKISRDANVGPILKHLANEVSEHQKLRLVLDLIPGAYIASLDDPFDPVTDRFSAAHRQLLETLSESSRQTVADRFSEILRDESGEFIADYGPAFFHGHDLAFVSDSKRNLVKDHLLSRVPKEHTPKSIQLLAGVENFLDRSDVVKWLDPFVRTLVAKNVNGLAKKEARSYLLDAITSTDSSVDNLIFSRLQDWAKHYDQLDLAENADVVRSLQQDMEAQLIPF